MKNGYVYKSGEENKKEKVDFAMYIREYMYITMMLDA